jgi:antitoxin (DNA-binding transcriptional repressor) of toxin-antitoxin stability system
VEKGEIITITKRGKAVAVLSPVQVQPKKDIKAVIEQMLAYREQYGPVLGTEVTLRQQKEEGRP